MVSGSQFRHSDDGHGCDRLSPQPWQSYNPLMKPGAALQRLFIGYLMLAFLAAPLLGAHIHLSQTHSHGDASHHHSIEAHSHLSLDSIEAGHDELSHHHDSIELQQDVRGKASSKPRDHKPLTDLASFADKPAANVATVLVLSLLPDNTRLADNYPCYHIHSRGPPLA